MGEEVVHVVCDEGLVDRVTLTDDDEALDENFGGPGLTGKLVLAVVVGRGLDTISIWQSVTTGSSGADTMCLDFAPGVFRGCPGTTGREGEAIGGGVRVCSGGGVIGRSVFDGLI